MPSLAIRAEGLEKSYQLGEAPTFIDRISRMVGAPARRKQDTLKALDGVSFEVEQGETIGIIGHNGAGKSTLLKLLSRITAPTNGGAEVYGSLASLLEVGTGFHPELTGRENTFLNGAILGMRKSEIQRHFDEIVDFAGIEKFIDTPVKRYSSGMYVRLAFSVAAHLQPDILVVDEVLAVGDTDFQKKCLGKMGDVGKSGRTVLFVSHNMAAVRQITTRCLLLSHGKVIFDGDPDRAIEMNAQAMSAAFTQGADLSQWPRQLPEQDRVVAITNLSFDHTSSIYGAEEPIVLLVTIRAREKVSGVRISGTILRSEGYPVGTFFSLANADLQPSEQHVYRLKLNGLNLAPGAYHFRLGVGTGNVTSARRMFDLITEVLPFNVSAISGGKGSMGNWHSTWGGLQIDNVEMKRIYTTDNKLAK